MFDVAERAGVSHQTVSRVLNGHPHTADATRERVLAAIAELGYRRNVAARSLATNRSHAIGVLTPAVAQYGATSSVLALEAAARDAGWHPLVTAAAIDAEATRAALGFLLDQSIEALVVIAPHAEVIGAIRELDVRVPLVTLQATAADGPPGTVVGVDQAGAMRLAVEHLVALGHRRIRHLAGPAGFFEADERRRGAEAAIAAAGASGGASLAGDWTAASGAVAAAALDAATTAVVAANDQMALGLIAGLAELGRRVPEDVSVTGFDDIPEAAYLRPALTTVRQDFDRVGRLALEVLLRRLEATPGRGDETVDGSEPAPSPIPPALVVRASTAPPRTIS